LLKARICVLATPLVLPPREEELAGLLLTEVDLERRRLRFGTRIGGDDYTKGKTDFVLPFPAELAPLLRALQGGRVEGPLVRPRRHFNSHKVCAFADHAALRVAYDAWLAREPKDNVRMRADRKDAFRRFLIRQGGISCDCIKKAFDALQRRAFGRVKVRFHDLRHAATDGMDESGVADQARRYMTGHKCSDIMDMYTTVELEREAVKYFASIRPLLDAIAARSFELGLTASSEAV
jgi:integrase